MPFIRQSRDKRGFESTYVLHNGRPGAGSGRPRVLYVFRSPANLRVGRRALDAEVREALEHTHPDLTFDWNSLAREVVVTRPEPAASKPARNGRPRPNGEASPAATRSDATTLGRTLGAATSARLRGRFKEVTDRIGRRSRTPEERDQLLERARALDPDAWPDEGTIREKSATFEAELNALAAELPSRRRGRRGGRHRHEGRSEAGPEQSAIMPEGDERYEESHDESLVRPDRTDDAGGDPAVGPTDEPEADIPDHD